MTRAIAFSLVVSAFALTSAAEAQSARCRIMDPTGTPLNVRDSPNGDVIGRMRNGVLVTRLRVEEDQRGRPWALIGEPETGVRIGWVYREFIACF